MPEQGPYATAKPLLGPLPQWLADPQEQQRVASYDLYEAIYWTVPDTFKLMSRGTEDKPIYVPAARSITETLHRFMAPKVKFVVDPQFGTPNDQALATQVMTDLARRERIYSRFNANKRYGIMRGDWMFHLFADPEREPGSKLNVQTVDPGVVFPIYNPDNIDEVIGWHLIEPTKDSGGKDAIRRTTYRKQTGTGGPSPIDVTDEIYKIDAWGGPGMDPEDAPLEVVNPPQTLPAPIDQLPIYHVQNFIEPGFFWGASEFRGLERIFAAVNQSISDEELALALEGLGCYATDAGTPVDDDGNEMAWNLGPGRVVETPPDKKFTRVTGVSQVTPYQDHLTYLHHVLDQAIGLSDVAKGSVDVKIAESGVALYLELAPLLARVEEKEQIVTDVVTNMLFDLPKWIVAYEGGIFNSLMDTTRFIPVYGDKVPQNKAAAVTELLAIASSTPQIVPMSYVRQKLRTLGYDDMPDEAALLTALAADQQVAADQQGARVDATINAALGNGAAQGADLSNLT
jgi:hypothetical protein